MSDAARRPLTTALQFCSLPRAALSRNRAEALQDYYRFSLTAPSVISNRLRRCCQKENFMSFCFELKAMVDVNLQAFTRKIAQELNVDR